MIIAGNTQGQVSGQADPNTLRLPKYDRTAFDYVIIAAGYLFMPLGLVLAVVRLLTSHYKNYRKATNHSLIYHAFVGGFIELVIMLFSMVMSDDSTVDFGTLMGMLGIFSVFLLLPAAAFASTAAKCRHQFAELAAKYVQLVTGSGVCHIGNLSRMSGQGEGDVRRDLQYLQQCGVLDTSLVFEEGYTESAAGSAAPVRSPGAGTPFGAGGAAGHAQTSAPQLPKSIRCPGCGAQNTVSPGQAKSCDYCGTTIPYS